MARGMLLRRLDGTAAVGRRAARLARRRSGRPRSGAGADRGVVGVRRRRRRRPRAGPLRVELRRVRSRTGSWRATTDRTRPGREPRRRVIRLSTPAESISRDADGVSRRTTARGEFVADYGIVAVPAADPEDAAVHAGAARRQARRPGAAADRDGGEAVRSPDRADRALGDAVGAGALLGVDGARRRRRGDAGRELLRGLARGGRAAARQRGPGRLGRVAAAAPARPRAGRRPARSSRRGTTRGRRAFTPSRRRPPGRTTRRRSAAPSCRSCSAASTPRAATAG